MSMNIAFFEQLLTDELDNFGPLLPDDILTAVSPIFPHTTALNFAAYHNCAAAVRFFQQNVPELFHVYSPLSPAHYAAVSNSVDVLELLEKDAVTNEGLTPLMLAAYYNQFEAASTLLFSNVCQELRTECLGMPAGSTALLFALKYHSKEVATLLLPFEALIAREAVQSAFIELFSSEAPIAAACGCFVSLDTFVQQSYQFIATKDEISRRDDRYRTPQRETQQTRDLEISAGTLREDAASRLAVEAKNQQIQQLEAEMEDLREQLRKAQEKSEKIVVLRPTNWKQRKFRQGKTGK